MTRPSDELPPPSSPAPPAPNDHVEDEAPPGTAPYGARESDECEWKRALPRSGRHLRTLAAFANGCGGRLVVGLNDAGEVVGVRNPDAVKKRLRREISEQIRPPLPYRLQVSNGRTPAGRSTPVVVVTVSPGDRRPYETRLSNGRWKAYLRERDRTVPLASDNAERVANPERSAAPKDRRAPDVLAALTRVRWATASELAKKLNLSKRRTQKILTGMARAGLVVEHNEAREARYALTPTGRRSQR